MMLIEIDHDALAAETSYRLERAHHSYDDHGRARHAALRAAATRLLALSRRGDRGPTWPAGVRCTPSAVPNHAAVH